ncbi:hypothetical protein ANCDUO_13795, partial [Ancylostoma duodenale]
MPESRCSSSVVPNQPIAFVCYLVTTAMLSTLLSKLLKSLSKSPLKDLSTPIPRSTMIPPWRRTMVASLLLSLPQDVVVPQLAPSQVVV